MARCRSCGAQIRWITTFAGKHTPVNAETIWFFPGEGSEEESRTERFVTEEGAVICGIRTEGNIKKQGSRAGYISHFATCPNADKHRKRSKNND